MFLTMPRRRLIVMLIGWLTCCAAWMAPAVASTRVFGPSGELRFVLHDPLEHPFYYWPRTLLSYPLRFEGAGVTPDHLVLVDEETGAPGPFQLSNVHLRDGNLESATLSFLSDLPSGATRKFVLRRAREAQARTTSQVKETAGDVSIVLDSGVMQVRIPASQTVTGEAPGPILQVSRGGRWFGSSRLVVPGHTVLSIESKRIESGPLFVTYQVRYTMAPAGRYTAVIRSVAGQDFVDFNEEIEDLDAKAEAYLEMTWTGLGVTHRQAPNHPFDPGHTSTGIEERIDAPQMNTHIGVLPGMTADGEMTFCLGPYQPWPAFRVGTFANFWNEHTNDTLGVFITKVGAWQDHDYSIWHSSPKLQVRYYYRDGLLSWRWPLATGARATALAFYDHTKDLDAVREMARTHAGVRGADGFLYRSGIQPTSHTLFLQNRYGAIDLNEVKDWVLEYPDAARHPARLFEAGRIQSAAALERAVLTSGLVVELPVSGTRQNGGFGPVPSRQVYDWWVDSFNRLYREMTPSQRRRVTAAYLMMAYVHAGEDYMPMIPMLSGHPNFLSDVKSVPALMAFLFPDHPMAGAWADEFAKYVELNTHYHTRPEVASWDACGGRWTENLGTYVWGFIRPAIRANFALEQRDGHNRFVSPELAEVGDWLVNALSAPFAGEDPAVAAAPRDMHHWGMVTLENGPRRIHPPQGAHAARRMTPRSMWLLGIDLQRYAPLTAEHLLWAARPTDQDQEQPLNRVDPWEIMYRVPANRGTNPHLTSRKYTGYGIVLRAAVDTPAELSVHLQQIDEGPNYRWGNSAEGGSGLIYFYAGGRAYSHNGKEDAGDRADQDTDFCTNFGVWKDGKFRSVGENVLDRPLYDLGVAQWAQLVPRHGPGAYSWPEYQSRTLMLVGQDYFVTYDDVFNEAIPHRFSWFVDRYDDFPFLQIVKGGGRDPDSMRTDVHTAETKGVWYDGFGDTMAVVSQRKDLHVESQSYGCDVHVDGGVDRVFFDPAGIDFVSHGIVFSGISGVVRSRKAITELALFHGRRIGAGGVRISTEDTGLGISARFHDAGELTGRYLARKASAVKIESASLAPAAAIFVDGEKQPATREEGALLFQAKPGSHRWQITAGTPAPNAPFIERTENVSGGARVFASPVAGATEYRIEVSRDNGQTWSAAAHARHPDIVISGLTNGVKVHVRAIAVNGVVQSVSGPEYPLYVNDQAPLPPDGLKVSLTSGAVRLSWGEILGAGAYRLYARTGPAEPFRLLYRGLARTYIDRNSRSAIKEYAVSSENGNGEGARSAAVTTDPASWLNFDPKPGEPFRRVPNLTEDTSTPPYYPK